MVQTIQQAVIVSAVRTPVGSFGGSLAGFTATQLGSIAIKAALERAGVQPSQVEEVFMGNVVSAGLGQAPARQAAIGAGLPPSVNCTTVNKVCASGTKAIALAAQAVMLGQAEIVVAGGMESMSNIPFYVPKARYGYKYGHGQLVDGLVRDGLEDVYQQKAMGVFADQTAAEHKITREAQDIYAADSYRKAQAATKAGKFTAEIVPVMIPQKKGEPIAFAHDEEADNVIFEKIANLKPAFTPDGTVTAANASTINDGAAALVVMSATKAEALGLKPLVRILAFADYEQEPEHFTTAPAKSIPKAVERAGLTMADMDFIEINEAFSVVPIAVGQLMGADMAKVNSRGGAVSIGHPLGASGARIVTSLAHMLGQEGARYGVAGICNGGGGSSAIVLEAVH